MSCFLEIERHSGNERRGVSTDPTSQAGIAEGACPGCGITPFRVVGAGLFRIPRGWKSGGKCVACGDSVGWVFIEAQTIFGTEEDERVLRHGRARVYR